MIYTAGNNMVERSQQDSTNNNNLFYNNLNSYLDRVQQTQENEKARKWQSNEWQKQFDLENDYNTPLKQASRLLSGGFNPYSFFGQTGTAQGSTPSMPIASSVGAPSSIGSHNSYTPNYMNPFSAFREMASGVRELADARKSGVETSQLEQKFSKELEKLDLANEYQDLRNSIFQEFGSARERAEVNEIIARAELTAQNALNAAYEGELFVLMPCMSLFWLLLVLMVLMSSIG